MSAVDDLLGLNLPPPPATPTATPQISANPYTNPVTNLCLDDAAGDLTVISGDGYTFRVKSATLKAASPIFERMITTTSPLTLPSPACDIHSLLHLLILKHIEEQDSHKPYSHIMSSRLSLTISLLEKYGCTDWLAGCEFQALTILQLGGQAYSIFAIACRQGWGKTAKLALKGMWDNCVVKDGQHVSLAPEHWSENQVANIGAHAYRALVIAAHKGREGKELGWGKKARDEWEKIGDLFVLERGKERVVERGLFERLGGEEMVPVVVPGRAAEALGLTGQGPRAVKVGMEILQPDITPPKSTNIVFSSPSAVVVAGTEAKFASVRKEKGDGRKPPVAALSGGPSIRKRTSGTKSPTLSTSGDKFRHQYGLFMPTVSPGFQTSSSQSSEDSGTYVAFPQSPTTPKATNRSLGSAEAESAPHGWNCGGGVKDPTNPWNQVGAKWLAAQNQAQAKAKARSASPTPSSRSLVSVGTIRQ